jgi:hypothetical protein
VGGFIKTAYSKAVTTVFGTSQKTVLQQTSSATIVSAIHALTEGLLKVWAPTQSVERRIEAIAQTVGLKTAEREKPPVVGVGVSFKAGQETLEILSDVESSDLDLDLLRGRANVGEIPIHVSETGEIVAASMQPQGGLSIGHPHGETGTITCAVADETGEMFLLSCGHVLAPLNLGRRKDQLWQPGKADGGGPDNLVGELYDYQALDFSVSTGNLFDAALCRPFRPVKIGVREVGRVNGYTDAPFDQALWKVGRSTGKTQGILFSKKSSLLITLAPGVRALFEDQLEVDGTGPKPFAAQGDSGALVVLVNGNEAKAIGVLIAVATGKNSAIVTPIKAILEQFKVALV